MLIVDFWICPNRGENAFNDLNLKTLIPALVYLGVLSSCLVYFLQFFLLQKIGSIRQTTVDFLVPCIGVVEGVIFNNDFVGESVLVIVFTTFGMVLGLTGIWFIHLDKDHK